MRNHLPIHSRRDAIIETMRRNQVTVIAGETGCGKTTLVPRFLYEEGFCRDGMIGVTEPRRVAATSVAEYVAGEMGAPLGGLVGYQIRHENRTDPDSTRIKYMTEGILLRELLADPLLERYDALVLDEVHERNINQDLVMALVKNVLARRPDLKVAAMSATINERRFAEYFSAPIIRIEGRMFPVAVEYLDDEPADFVIAAVEKTRDLLARTAGDILIFMPDYESIRETLELLAADSRGATLLTLFGGQSPEEQRNVVFGRTGRNVIVATNVAETSVTLDGVTAVVDTGKVKEMRYFPSTAMSSLKVVSHSRAGLEQRAGRAGRTAPGICCRLFAQHDLRRRPEYTQPEMLRTSLDQVLLQLKAMGFDDDAIEGFDFLDPPAHGAWHDARESLALLGALDGEGGLTPTGEIMSDIPLPPAITKMVLSAQRFGCMAPVIAVAASFSTRPVFIRPPGQEEAADRQHERFRDPRSDFLTLLNALKAWRSSPDPDEFARVHYLHGRALAEIEATSAQIAGILVERGMAVSEGSQPDAIGRSVAAGLVGNLMTLDGGRSYKTRRRNGVFIFPGSSLYGRQSPSYAVAAEIVETTRPYARGVQEVYSRWLGELLPPRDKRKRGKRREKRRFHSRRR